MGKRLHLFFTVIFICIAFLGGCFQQKKHKKYLETFYPSGALKSKGWFWRDNIFVDTAYYYFENGNLSSIEVHNDSGILNGISRFFHENGKPYQVINFANGAKEGFIDEYSKDGKLFSKVFYLKNKQIGDCYWYNNDGTVLSRYGFYDFEGLNRNLIKWDSIGNIIKDLRPVIFIDSTRSYYDTNSKQNEYSYNIMLLISNPPKCRSTVKIDYITRDGFVMKSDSITGKAYYFTKQNFVDSLTTIKYIGTQYDSLNKKNSYQTVNVNVVQEN